MFKLKYVHADAIPAAIEKADRYRLLNEPEQAASICQDVLRIDPDHQDARKSLILALTDQFAGPRPVPASAIREHLPKLQSEYDRAYFAGIIAEREGIAWLRSEKPRAGATAYDCFREAMKHFEQAEPLRPAGNDDVILRWNSCARMIDSHADVAPADEGLDVGAQLGD